MRLRKSFALLILLLVGLTPLTQAAEPLATVETIFAEPLDLPMIAAEDLLREENGEPPRFAIPQPVVITPETHGNWENLGGGMRLWRLRVSASGAASLNFGFGIYKLPEGAALNIHAADDSYALREFTDADNESHGELWTPLVLSDDAVIELTVPLKAASRVKLELSSINVGYRGFGSLSQDRSGSCNNDVVCPEADGWRNEIPSVGAISTGGSLFCTGFMVNNTAEDETPYFMTANHCGISSGNAASLVVYWNFESPNCGDQCCGSLADNQSGAFFRTSSGASDVTLVELDEMPNPDHEVSYAGWDRSPGDYSGAIAIHHPSVDEKAISWEYDPTTTTTYLSNSVPGDGTHIRITAWDDGTTEPGSSGSPLFSPGHRVIGQLHGGYASCSSNTSDWYGRFSVSWTGAGLGTWLDPIGSGAMTTDTLVPGASGLRVTPGSGLAASGPVGGPFSPSSLEYTLENRGDTPLNYSVTYSEPWVSVSNASGSIAALATTTVTVSINAGANGLPAGLHTDNIIFTNTTDGDGDTTRPISVEVGGRELVYSVNMDGNPGWTTQGQWAFGQPTGGGGEHGNNDPTAGYDGPNVYGYNLSGDYTNNMPEYSLTSTPFDCSNLNGVLVKFRRHLNVEQPTYDHAYFRASGGGAYSTIFQNGSEITDSSWNLVEYDISGVADGQAAVNLRWTMGTTDSSWLYSGWNIDNVEIWAFNSDLTAAGDAPAPTRTALLPNVPNPFNPKTEIRYELAEAGDVSLEIYDVSGRRIATLLAGSQRVGGHSVQWNGTSDTGEPVSSGIYFARLSTASESFSRKITLLK